jgi:hypothetical protein
MQGKSLTHKILQVFSNENEDAVDIRAGVPVLEYRESVLCPYITIDIAIVDSGTAIQSDDGSKGTIGILESIKLQGTEKFKFKIADDLGNIIDLSKDTDLRVAKTVFASKSVKESSVLIRVVSKEAYDNTLIKNRLTDTYYGFGNEIVRAALDSMGTEKEYFFDTTDKRLQFNGDKRYPFEMCLDVQKVSSSPQVRESAGFLFWETSKGYNFRSLDNMFDTTGKEIKKFEETGFADAQVSEGFNGKILKSNFIRISDMLHQFEEGAYSTQLELFDPVAMTLNLSQRDTATEPDDRIIAGTQMPVVNEELRDEATVDLFRQNDDGQTVIPGQDIQQNNLATKFDIKSVSTQALQNYRQKFSSSLNIVIDADLSLSAGDLVFCKFPETSQKKTQTRSNKDSGIYMIADLCHYSTPTQAFTGLNLVRDSYGVKT